MKPDNGWHRRFDEPIPLPRGRLLVTLQDAGNYITKLSKAEHQAPEWQASTEALILVAESNGPTMFARIHSRESAATIANKPHQVEHPPGGPIPGEKQ